ncbi:MAG: PIN domain-containing protein [Candidatus Dormibacteraeota bacterium]|nr:PIN domain-containing protein [Candidatus Dormibacteraeota bacterium]
MIALWLGGAFELVVSEAQLAELDRTLAHPKLRQHIDPKDAADFRQLVRSTASMFAGAEHPDHLSSDPADDYLVALATASVSILVTGDSHLLVVASELPRQPPAVFLARVER